MFVLYLVILIDMFFYKILIDMLFNHTHLWNGLAYEALQLLFS
jgi:hypothetical protein